MAEWYEERHPIGSQRFFDEFASALAYLESTPTIGRTRDDLRPGLRQWPVYPFTLYYVVDDTEHIVALVHVIHARMNVTARAFEDEEA